MSYHIRICDQLIKVNSFRDGRPIKAKRVLLLGHHVYALTEKGAFYSSSPTRGHTYLLTASAKSATQAIKAIIAFGLIDKASATAVLKRAEKEARRQDRKNEAYDVQQAATRFGLTLTEQQRAALRKAGVNA